ncbi:AzlC family ABC transporter permease [Phyllobacterium sp. K27]
MADSGIPTEETQMAERTPLRWFLAGASLIGSIPALILMTAHVGFAGFASENGVTMLQATFMVATIWALPANIVLIGAISGGYSVIATAIAVGLSSIRLMPMVAAFIPEVRGPKTKKRALLPIAHFIAITAYVIGMEKLKHVPRDMRLTFFAGLGVTLTTVNALVVAVVYWLSASFPPLVFAALFFLTPMYFLSSLWGSARDRSVHVAMVAGLLLFPLIHMIAPAYDLLLTGFVGGLVTMIYVRLVRMRGGST